MSQRANLRAYFECDWTHGSGQLKSWRWWKLRPERPLRNSALLAQAESCHNLAIPIRVAPVQIIQQTPPLVDHHDQPAP